MKVKANNRISALQRLSKPASGGVHQRLTPATTSSAVTDARQLLSNRNKPVFDARQLLSRQASKTNNDVLIIRRDAEPNEEDEEEMEGSQGPFVLQRSTAGRLTAATSDRPGNKLQNPFAPTKPVSLKKTISNPSYERPAEKPKASSLSSDQKVVISFTNDQYRKRPRSPSPSPPPVVRRLDKLSSSSSRNSVSEPAKKQAISKAPVKQFSTSAKKANLDASTILITNLQSSVTEDDVMELFGEVGDIKEIKTLSRGCVQVIYSKQKDAEAAVEKYHNALLDGQLMYVSLQQQPSVAAAAATTTTTKSDSKKFSLDPSFIRQALFNSSTSQSTVQFQVKL